LIAGVRTKRNPYATAHKRIRDWHPARVIHSNLPYYIRGVHGLNYSRSLVRDTSVQPEGLPMMIARFPCLTDIFADYALIDAAACDLMVVPIGATRPAAE